MDYFSAYMSKFSNVDVLTAEQELSLYNQLRNGIESARDELVRHNMRLVLKMANNYKNYGMGIEDLISNGTVGLLKAIEHFDASRGTFATYARWWIKKYIVMGLNHSGIVNESRWERGKTRSESISLESPIGDDGLKIGDTFFDDGDNPQEFAEKQDIKERLMDAIDCLNEKERFIVTARNGIGAEEAMTLEQIARRLNVTRERVRQLEEIALDKLRKHFRQGDWK